MKPTPSMIGFGEDYELLFTVPRRELHKLVELPCRVTRIGEIIPENFIVLDGDGKEMDVSDTGYNHLT
jgi:thiamine monophosphate kinase